MEALWESISLLNIGYMIVSDRGLCVSRCGSAVRKLLHIDYLTVSDRGLCVSKCGSAVRTNLTLLNRLHDRIRQESVWKQVRKRCKNQSLLCPRTQFDRVRMRLAKAAGPVVDISVYLSLVALSDLSK